LAAPNAVRRGLSLFLDVVREVVRDVRYVRDDRDVRDDSDVRDVRDDSDVRDLSDVGDVGVTHTH
jgi:hypothetical protein